MGDRGQIKINNVYLYTHWGASDLINVVKKALAKKWRWGDELYLARIIFDELVGEDCCKTDTGYGIGTVKQDDAWRIIDISNYSVNRIEIIDNDKIVWSGTYEQFLECDYEGSEC